MSRQSSFEETTSSEMYQQGDVKLTLLMLYDKGS